MSEVRSNSNPSISADSPRGSRRRRTAPLAILLPVLFVLGVLTVQTVVPPAGAVQLSGIQPDHPPTTGTCNPYNPSPSALSTPGPAPSFVVHAGRLLNATVEYRVVNYSSKVHDVKVYLPSVSVVFPLVPSGKLTLFGLPQVVATQGKDWVAPSNWMLSKTLTMNYSFNSGSPAYATTSKYAVMATIGTGNLTVEFRWRWSVFNPTTQTTTKGTWTVPGYGATLPFLPSIFFPASWVGLLGNSTSPAPAGSVFNLTLNGHVKATWFRVVLEWPSNGTEIQSIIENTSATGSVFNASVPLSYSGGTPVAGGNYLIHIHDHCEAIVRMLGVTAY